MVARTPCTVRKTMVPRRGARGAQDHGREQGCAEPIILRINFVLAHPCRRGRYAGRMLPPAVAPTRNDDNREVQSTGKERWMKFKNDKERIAFLEDYRNDRKYDGWNGWYLWKYDEDLQRTWWRLDLPDRSSLVVEEQKRTFSWPNVHTDWAVIHWYIVTDWNGSACFGDYVASRTQALTKIKEVEKGMRNGD